MTVFVVFTNAAGGLFTFLLFLLLFLPTAGQMGAIYLTMRMNFDLADSYQIQDECSQSLYGSTDSVQHSQQQN